MKISIKNEYQVKVIWIKQTKKFLNFLITKYLAIIKKKKGYRLRERLILFFFAPSWPLQ